MMPLNDIINFILDNPVLVIVTVVPLLLAFNMLKLYVYKKDEVNNHEYKSISDGGKGGG